MKYVITGGAGHISKPLALQLLKNGHEVKVIGRNADNLKDLVAAGAEAAAGSLEDSSFLSDVFKDADAVYVMLPQNFVAEDFRKFQNETAQNIIDALKTNKIKKLVFLSSIGAHMGKGAGPVDGLADFEKMLTGQLPEIDAVFLRPSYFYYNLFRQTGMIKGMNIMGDNFIANDEKLVLTHTDDIAKVAAEILQDLSFKGKTVRYIASDERTTDEIAKVLSAAVGKEGIPWIQFTDEQSSNGMLQMGLKPAMVKDYLQLGIVIREGKFQEDYWKNRPELGKIKLEDFAKEFAAAFKETN